MSPDPDEFVAPPEPELPAEDEEFPDEEFSEPGHVLSSVLLEMRDDVRY